MSRAQNDFPIHWRERIADCEGETVWTACGQVVMDEAATTDCIEVTCEARGCVAAAEAAFEARKRAKAVKW